MASIMKGFQAAPPFSDVYPSADALKFTISAFTARPVESSQVIRGFLDSIPVFTERLEEIVCEGASDESLIEMPAESLDALRQAAPIIPEETRPRFEEAVAHEPESQHKYLNFETLKWLISVILTL